MINTRDKQVSSLKGTNPSEKLHAVLLFELYFGVAATSGLNIYRQDNCSY